MVRLHKVKMVNFGPFLDETIVFPEKGLVLLDGESGHGKSTVLVAIAYALDIAPSEYTAAALQNWGGGPMQVVLTVERDGEFVDIAKGKRSYVKYGDSPEKTGSKAVQEELKKLFLVDSDLLSVMVYRPQKAPGLFLSRGDADKKAFLSTVLNLDAIEASIDASTETIKKLENEVLNIGATLAKMSSFLEPIERPDTKSAEVFLDDVREAEDDVVFQENKLDQLQKQLKSIAHELIEANREQAMQVEAKAAEAQNMVDQLKSTDSSRRARFEERRMELSKEIRGLASVLYNSEASSRKIKDIERELEKLNQSLCYTCNRPWDDVQAKRAELESKLEAHKKQSDIGDAQARHDGLYQELTTMGSFVPNPTITKLEVGIANANAKVRELRSGSMNDPEFARCQENVQTTTADYYKAKNKATAMRKEVENVEAYNKLVLEQYRRKLDSNKKLTDAIENEKASLMALEASLAQERDFKDALGTTGFLGLIFDEVLNEISSETNRYLATLKNVSHVTIGFRSESLNTKGNIKRSIVPVVTVNGHETSLRAGVSGGMATSIEMAVDFGVLGVVERRCGAAPGWLALDECFTGQPASTKEAAMEILAQHAQDRLILVVDHSSEFKELFAKTIKIEMENGTSKVKL